MRPDYSVIDRGDPVGPRINRQRAPGLVAVSALVLAVLCIIAFVAVDLVFVHTVWGQRIDDAGLAGSVIGRARIISDVHRVLDLVSVSALALAAVAVAALGLMRRKPGVALFAVVLLAGSNVCTQLLKTRLLHRPDLGVDPANAFAGNTLPSGHTTVAMSVAAAVLLVVPPRWRAPVAILGCIGSAAMGVATLSAGWHRPSDAVTAFLVVTGWAAGLAAVTAAVRTPRPVPAGVRGSTRVRGSAGVAGAAGLLATLGVVVGVGGGVALVVAGHVPGLDGRHHLLAAYAGGSACIAGTAAVATAVLLVIVHLIDPPGVAKTGRA